MEDKRKTTNEELEQTLNSGILSVAPQPQINFENFPDLVSTENTTNQNVLNTFNVNVNVSGQKDSKIDTAANQTMKNMLPTLNGSPEQIKKNSSVTLVNNSEKIVETRLNDLMPDDYSKNIFKTDFYSQTPSIPILNIAKQTIPETEASWYSYSDSSIKKNDPKTAREYSVLKNIIYNSFPELNNSVAISPHSTHDNSLYVQNVMGERIIQQMQNLKVENNLQNNLELANQISRQRERQTARQDNLLDKLSNQTTNQEENNITKKDIAEATILSPKEGEGSAKTGNVTTKTASNLNGNLRDNPIFIAKMNSPPNWRTVLG